MAYPGENEHVEYLDYLEQHAMGSSDQGPAMSKEVWRQWRLAQQAAQAPAPALPAPTGGGLISRR